MNRSIMLIVLCLAFNGGVVANEDFPAWLKGKPDTRIYPQRAGLYSHVFREAESTLGVSLADRELATKRIVNAVNKAVDHWKLHGNSEYAAELPYIVIGEDRPLHYRFSLTETTLRQFLPEN